MSACMDNKSNYLAIYIASKIDYAASLDPGGYSKIYGYVLL